MRGFFTQHGIQPEEVAREIEATDSVLGDPQAVRRFLADALQRFGGSLDLAKNKDGVFKLSAGELKTKLEEFAGGGQFPIMVTFDRRKDEEAIYLGRTQPLVARVCDAVLGEAFAPDGDQRFARAGAMFTDAVNRWTALLLMRFRYRLLEATEKKSCLQRSTAATAACIGSNPMRVRGVKLPRRPRRRRTFHRRNARRRSSAHWTC
jgi:hypothetical protein